MKAIKRIFILALVLGMSACAPKELEREADVSFSLRGVVTGGMPTKSAAIDPESLSSLFSATLPPGGASLTLVSQTNSQRTYSATVGQTLTVACDSYSVKGGWEDEILDVCYSGYLFRRPSYSVAGSIEVGEAGGVFPLDASWECSAIVIPSEGVSKVELRGSDPKKMTDVTGHFTKGGSLSVLYVRAAGSWSVTPMLVRLTPTDDLNYETTTFELTSVFGKGKWYYFTPGEVETSSGDISITFPEWSEGQ